MCNCSNNNNYITINICSLSLSAYNHFVSNNSCSIQWRSSIHEYSLYTQCVFTQDWLNYYWLSSSLVCTFIVQHNQSNESSWSRRFMFLPSQELSDELFVVVSLLELCSMYLLMRIAYTLSLVASAFSILFLSSSYSWCLFLQLLLTVSMWNDIEEYCEIEEYVKNGNY